MYANPKQQSSKNTPRTGKTDKNTIEIAAAQAICLLGKESPSFAFLGTRGVIFAPFSEYGRGRSIQIRITLTKSNAREGAKNTETKSFKGNVVELIAYSQKIAYVTANSHVSTVLNSFNRVIRKGESL